MKFLQEFRRRGKTQQSNIIIIIINTVGHEIFAGVLFFKFAVFRAI